MQMHRRDFVRLAGLGVAAGSAAATAAKAGSVRAEPTAPPAAKATMKVGTQHDSSDDVLGILAALGVTNICSRLPSARLDDQWSVEGLTRLRERVEHFGITLDMVPLPMSSNPIARAENPNILLGKSPERDREIDAICQMIRNASRAGIPALK
jgi:mannonate dehydratase